MLFCRTYKCYECKKEFSSSLELRDHIKDHVKEELKLKNPAAAENVSFELEKRVRNIQVYLIVIRI